MIGTILKRENAIYMLLFGFIGHFVTVAVLHIFNGLALPSILFKGYILCNGWDALLVPHLCLFQNRSVVFLCFQLFTFGL
jgi:cbb3-type cytochrome oxidase subunit 1